MLVDELAGYLVGAGLGLTTAPPAPNLFTRPFPPGVPDTAVCIVVWNTDTVDTYGVSLSAPAMEIQDFKIIVRAKEQVVARSLAYEIYLKVRRLGPVTLSGVQYHNVEASPPMWLSTDEADFPRYHFDARAWKQESAA